MLIKMLQSGKRLWRYEIDDKCRGRSMQSTARTETGKL